jgi:hypothetical protein
MDDVKSGFGALAQDIFAKFCRETKAVRYCLNDWRLPAPVLGIEQSGALSEFERLAFPAVGAVCLDLER